MCRLLVPLNSTATPLVAVAQASSGFRGSAAPSAGAQLAPKQLRSSAALWRWRAVGPLLLCVRGAPLLEKENNPITFGNVDLYL